eukprot:TRINITY_DN9056_c0_g1_i1.p1 TRINITY_DN9056_c0_g1~~TRINITY_DN9056_c0_g1_i1.p1  ORF type:complete len:705 (+),score=73.42 TRINITY_DN9056_c0_g1_i1:425-2539(+)
MKSLDSGLIALALFVLFYELQFLGGLHLVLDSQVSLEWINNGGRPVSAFSKSAPAPSSNLIPPVIADLDDDGVSEILLAGGGNGIYVANWVGRQLVEKKFIQLSKVTGSTCNPEECRVLKMGAYCTQTNSTKQSVVVVTNSLDLLVFDDQLELLWASAIPDDSKLRLVDDKGLYEIALLGFPVPIWRGDRGAITVGIRPHVQAEIDAEKWHHETDYLRQQSEKQKEAPANDATAEDILRDLFSSTASTQSLQENHVNYFCFDSSDGSLRWRYLTSIPDADEFGRYEKPPPAANAAETDAESEGREFREGEILDLQPEPFYEQVDAMMSSHSWKLHVAAQSMHFDHRPWTTFHDSVVESLPHAWFSTDDTTLELLHFQTQFDVDRRKKKKVSWGQEAVGIAAASSQNQDVASTTRTLPPNTLVAHTSLGLEAIHLYTGKPLTSLSLRHHSLYEDINGDHSIDQVWTRVGREAGRMAHGGSELACSVLIGSGVPHVKRVTFNTSLCAVSSPSWFSSVPTFEGSDLEVLHPVIMTHHTPYDYLLNIAPTDQRLFFFLSNGVLTSLVPFKESLWQLQTDAAWSVKNPLLQQMKPSLTLYPLTTVLDGEEALLVVASRLVLISPSGSILASTALLPHVPTAAPALGDFDNNGLMDLILRTEDSFLLYSLRGSTSNMIFSVVMALLLVGILLSVSRRFLHASTASTKKLA